MAANEQAVKGGPLHVFPLELWILILNRMDDTIDRFNTLQSLPQLEALLRVEKLKLCFGKVLSMIGKYLTISDILTTRQVCKMWHCDLHNLINNHPFHMPYNEDPQNGLPLNTLEVNKRCSLFKLSTSNPILRFCNGNRINQFLELAESKNFSGRSIFGRTVYFNPSPRTEISSEQYISSSIEFLDKFGSQINHLILGSHREFETTVDFYKRLRAILERTPNLKSLCINFENQDDTTRLSLLIARRPLPALHFLQSVRIEQDCNEEIADISEAILSLAERVGSRIRKLVIPRLNRYFTKNYTSTFCNLTELEILDGFDERLFLQLKGSKIQKLVVSRVRLCSGFKLLDLSELRVLFTHIFYIHDNCSLRLPKLHTLRFVDEEYLDCNFLLQFSSLKLLEIERCTRPQESTRRYVECLGFGKNEITKEMVNWVYFGPVKNSPVWKWLPTLKQIRVCTLNAGKTRHLKRWTTFCRP